MSRCRVCGRNLTAWERLAGRRVCRSILVCHRHEVARLGGNIVRRRGHEPSALVVIGIVWGSVLWVFAVTGVIWWLIGAPK